VVTVMVRVRLGSGLGWVRIRVGAKENRIVSPTNRQTRQNKQVKDKTRQDTARHDKARYDKTRYDKKRQHKTRQDKRTAKM
jgi:hypothetical protein